MDLRAKLGRLRAEALAKYAPSDLGVADRELASAADCELASAVHARAELAGGEALELVATASRPLVADTSQPPAVDARKTERIAQLRALIGEVAQRDRVRAQRRTVAWDTQLSDSGQPARLAALADALALQARVKPVTFAEALSFDSPRRGPLPWERAQTAWGELHSHTRWLEPQHQHGRAPVSAALRMQAGTLAALTRDPDLTGIDLARALYLDTETTGLAGGTGTVAFLVGLARFEDGALCVEQLIVPELGHEAPVLAKLTERLAAASCIVTYNGKSFDWPLLRTRYVLSRMPVPVLPAHVDLLHAARRIWKPRLASVRLSDVEREVLHFFREDDIAGHEIPGRYFAFLRDGSASELVPVLEHNQNDLIALAALLGALITRFECVSESAHPQDVLSFGRLALRAHDLPRALEFAAAAAAAALAASETCDLYQHSLLFSSEVQRQAGDAAQAAALLEQLLGSPLAAAPAAPIHFVLAKLYEHALGDFRAALRHARHTEPVEGPLAHGRRRGRLYRRLLRGAEQPA